MALGVAAAAWGAHGLERVVEDAHLREVWATGVRMHLLHALALVGLGWRPGAPRATGWLLLTGIALFSGSLYALALSGVRVLGAITPLGGLAFILGWLWLAWRGPPGAGPRGDGVGIPDQSRYHPDTGG